jgi:hypothetical protein
MTLAKDPKAKEDEEKKHPRNKKIQSQEFNPCSNKTPKRKVKGKPLFETSKNQVEK